MNIVQKGRMSNVLKMLDYMASEIKSNIANHILLTTQVADQYAIKHELRPDLTIGFYLYNTKNQTTAGILYTYEEFAGLCSDVIIMENTFTKLAEDLIEAVQVTSTDIKMLKKSSIII